MPGKQKKQQEITKRPLVPGGDISEEFDVVEEEPDQVTSSEESEEEEDEQAKRIRQIEQIKITPARFLQCLDWDVREQAVEKDSLKLIDSLSFRCCDCFGSQCLGSFSYV